MNIKSRRREISGLCVSNMQFIRAAGERTGSLEEPITLTDTNNNIAVLTVPVWPSQNKFSSILF